jgi:hypothetical protein
LQRSIFLVSRVGNGLVTVTVTKANHPVQICSPRRKADNSPAPVASSCGVSPICVRYLCCDHGSSFEYISSVLDRRWSSFADIKRLYIHCCAHA